MRNKNTLFAIIKVVNKGVYMFEITTDKQKRNKKVKIDGYTYDVRKAGAGDSLTMQQAGREITKLGKLTNPSEQDSERIEKLTIKTLQICLGLFDSLGDKEAEQHLNSLDVETLMEVIQQIFEDDDGTAQAS